MGEVGRDVLKNTGPAAAGRKDYRLPVIVPITLYTWVDHWTTIFFEGHTDI